jgi:phenylalanine-4-hydroxylase
LPGSGPSATERAIANLPRHLRRYVVAQDYDAYTPREHAVWRHILRRLAAHLSDKAHASYLQGLAATGIGLDVIPSLDTMNEKLATIGWSCVGVRGFIPPAVFTELQARGVLAIAADIRSHEHIAYTPAPDIVHESAGHAPILADTRYANYLRRCGEIGFRAIASVEDEAVFRAIRTLSVVKEDPSASPEDVAHAEAHLVAASASRRYVSENTKASRLYWWTAEYGLVGSLAAPKLYGAGLLSSLGEASHCLTDAVEKLPLDVSCVDREYDITRMQPQLFVARDFAHLDEVLAEFEGTLAFRRGGDFGLREALRARATTHLVTVDSDGNRREITGRVAEVDFPAEATSDVLSARFVRLEGPILVSQDYRAVGGPRATEALVFFGEARLPSRGAFDVSLGNGLRVAGYLAGQNEVVDVRVWFQAEPVVVPSVALVFFAVSVPSVAGGPSDPGAWDDAFGALDAFASGDAEERARASKAASLPNDLANAYADLRRARDAGSADVAGLEPLLQRYPNEWLLREELAELRARS